MAAINAMKLFKLCMIKSQNKEEINEKELLVIHQCLKSEIAPYLCTMEHALLLRTIEDLNQYRLGDSTFVFVSACVVEYFDAGYWNSEAFSEKAILKIPNDELVIQIGKF